MYVVWIKIDGTLPWIELKGEYQTRREAKEAANEFLNVVKIKTVEIPEKRSPMKALAFVKATR
ncbi:MAG: hypothetical protein OEZ18_05115 [Candidatus Bathyarchaeota archaeon]|nr:hypothetical protein [Candidatus Bathyarchaeota archaeon]